MPASILPASSVPVPQAPRRVDWVGTFLVGIPAAAGLLRLLTPWVGLAAWLTIVTIVSTVVLIGVDAKRRGQPVTEHVVSAVVMWAVFYPVYLHRRARWGAPRLLWPGLLAVGLFVAGTLFPAAPWGGRAKVEVRCEVAGSVLGDGLRCTATPRAGLMRSRACWRVELQCEHGVRGEVPETCVDVRPPSPSIVEIPFQQMERVDACTTLTSMQLDRLVVTPDIF